MERTIGSCDSSTTLICRIDNAFCKLPHQSYGAHYLSADKQYVKLPIRWFYSIHSTLFALIASA